MTKKLLLILFSFWLLTSCKEQPKMQPQPLYKKEITPDDIQSITPEEAKAYHKDIHYQYEYRTGSPGNYEYNYEVKGLDQEGDSVLGAINIKGKYGAGTIINREKKSIDIYVEWIDYGKLKGKDEEGNIYKLEAN